MSKLPEPNWISLQECLDLVVDRTGATAKAVEWALVDAFTDNRIVTLGCCPTYIRARTGDTPTRLNGIAWRGADVSWKTGKFRIPRRAGYGQGYGPLFHTFEKVAVRREDVIRWLSPDDGGAPPGGQGTKPLGSRVGMAKLTAWLQKRYDGWAPGKAAPTIQKDWDAARNAKELGGADVTRKQIETARGKVNSPAWFYTNKPGPKPRGN